MEVINIAEAKKQNLNYYFTGKACKNGHIDKRLISNRRCAECSRSMDRARYANNPEKEKDRSRKYQRKHLPTPTRPCPKTCELCGKPPKNRSLHLDHNHVTGQFRGWLCSNCNTSLGKFGDDIKGLQHAIFYLRRGQQDDSILPHDPAERKKIPISSGVLDYFPLAIIEIAKVSYTGNLQHNPGQPLHWSRGKSDDHADTMQRHFSERGKEDIDGHPHSAKMAWRALAILQLECEEKKYGKKNKIEDTKGISNDSEQPANAAPNRHP